jgi:hypothetical protein
MPSSSPGTQYRAAIRLVPPLRAARRASVVRRRLLPGIPLSISFWIVRKAARRAAPADPVPCKAKKAAQRKKIDSWESRVAMHGRLKPCG